MSDKIILKDLLFNKEKVQKLSKEIKTVYPVFKDKLFINRVISKFPELELKARIGWITECLAEFLPKDYRQAVKVILQALPEPNNPDLSDNDFGDYIYAPYSEFIVRFGCNEKNLDFSLDAIRQITMRFSAEDAIRYFINAFPKQTLQKLLEWSNDSNYHVRRLCSEGTRPKLPWSQKIKISVTEPLTILDNLYADKTRYVTRSVANHINDISKIDPKLALDILKQWKKEAKQNPKELDYIIRHSLRTLIKEGNAGALGLIGISKAEAVDVSRITVPNKVKLNTHLDFSFEVQAKDDARILVDYIIYFQNQSGKINRRKVYKLNQLSLVKGEKITITKRHLLRENMTTLKLFKGVHEIEMQVNGMGFGRKKFLIE